MDYTAMSLVHSVKEYEEVNVRKSVFCKLISYLIAQ